MWIWILYIIHFYFCFQSDDFVWHSHQCKKKMPEQWSQCTNCFGFRVFEFWIWDFCAENDFISNEYSIWIYKTLIRTCSFESLRYSLPMELTCAVQSVWMFWKVCKQKLETWDDFKWFESSSPLKKVVSEYRMKKNHTTFSLKVDFLIKKS